MKLNDVILLEHYVNLFSREDKKQYVDIIWDMLAKAYEPIGGFKSAVDKDDLIDNSSIWKLVRRNGKIVAFGIYKDSHGRKSIAGATDGTALGKADFMKLKTDDFAMNRAWCEASGKIEHILIKLGVQPISNKLAAKLTGKEILNLDPDGVHYTRLIQGEPHTKIIFGFPAGVEELQKQVSSAGYKLNTAPE